METKNINTIISTLWDYIKGFKNINKIISTLSDYSSSSSSSDVFKWLV